MKADLSGQAPTSGNEQIVAQRGNWPDPHSRADAFLEAKRIASKEETRLKLSLVTAHVDANVVRLPGRGIGWKRASDFQPRNVEWLWTNRICGSRVNLLAGMGDVGKDVLCCTLAAIVSNEQLNWPDGETCQTHGKVGYVTTEDEPEDTLRPRLEAAGANIDNIFIWSMSKLPTADDMDGLSMLVVSPLVEIMNNQRGGRKDDHSDRDARSMIKPWAEKAKEIGCVIIGIVHYNKKNDLSAVQRILGSVGLPNLLRNTWCVEKDDEDETLRLFLPVKGNLSPDGHHGLAYRISHVGPWSQSITCVWQSEPVTKGVDQVIQAKVKNGGGKQSAEAWLLAYLKEHGEVRRDIIIEAAKRQNFSEAAIRKAKENDGKRPKPRILDTKIGFPAIAFWRLADS